MIGVSVCVAALPPASPQYSETHSITLKLSFSSGSADCTEKIVGGYGTTKISNCTTTLTDSKGNLKGEWKNLPATGSTLSFTKTAYDIAVGDTYTLAVSADVTRNGKIESVSESIIETY